MEFAVCWRSQVPSWAKPNGNWIQSRMSGWHMIFTEIWHCLCKQHTLLPHSGNHLGFMCERLKTGAGEHLMLCGSCDVFPTLAPLPGCPCICKHGSLSHGPTSSLPTEVFFLCSAVAVNGVGLYEVFAQGFIDRVRGKLSCLSQGTIILLAKSCISSWVHSFIDCWFLYKLDSKLLETRQDYLACLCSCIASVFFQMQLSTLSRDLGLGRASCPWHSQAKKLFVHLLCWKGRRGQGNAKNSASLAVLCFSFWEGG